MKDSIKCKLILGLVWQPTWAHLKELHAAVKQAAQPLLYGTYSNSPLGNLAEVKIA
jgi:hypothetical protein